MNNNKSSINKKYIFLSIILGLLIITGTLLYITSHNNNGISKQEEVKLYTVTFATNGGVVSTNEITLKEGEEYGTLPTPTRKNYEFIGWFTEKDGGTKVDSKTIIDNNTTLYAHWKKDESLTEVPEYKLYYDANGGTVNPTDITLCEKEEYGTLPTPIRKDYDFIGWYTEKDKGTKVDSTTVINNNTTIYAHWEKNKSKSETKSQPKVGGLLLYFETNGGYVTPNRKTLNKGEQYGTLPTPVKNDYEFIGWYTEKDGGIKVDSTTTIKTNTTIYAHWKGLTITAEKSNMLTTTNQKLTTKTTDNTIAQNIAWESNNTNIATVDNSGNVLAKRPGEVTIIAKTNTGMKAETKITIEKANIVLIGNSKTYRENIQSGSFYLELENILLNRNFEVNLYRISKGATSLYEKAMNEVENMDFSEAWNKTYDIAILQEDYKYVPNKNIYRTKGYYEGANAVATNLRKQNPNITIYIREGYYKYTDSIDEWYSINEKGINNTQTIAEALNMHHIKDCVALNNYVRQYVVTSENLKKEYIEVTLEKKKHLKPKGAYLLAACVYKSITNNPATNITYYTEDLSKAEATQLLEIANEC